MSKSKSSEQEKQDQAPKPDAEPDTDPWISVHRARQIAMLGISHAWRDAAAKKIQSDNQPGMLRRIRLSDILDAIQHAVTRQ